MGIVRIIADFDVRRFGEVVGDLVRGWGQADVDSLQRKFDEPFYYSGGIIKITVREHRAWRALNRRLLAQNPRMIRSPVLAWAEGKGLFPMIRLLPAK